MGNAKRKAAQVANEPRVMVGVPMERHPMHTPQLFFSFIQLAQQGWTFVSTDYNRTDVQRNKFAVHLLKNPTFTHLLMLDSDELHPPQTITRLVERVKENPEIEVIAGLAYRRGEPYEPMVYKRLGLNQLESMVEVAYTPGLYECDAVSTGAIMVSRKVFERLPYPWFRYDYDAAQALGWPDCPLEAIDAVGLRSEDIYFCELCRNHGIKIWADTTVQSAHASNQFVTRDTFLAHMRQTPAYKLLETLTNATPELFGAQAVAGKVLYVGARTDRAVLANELSKLHTQDLLEIWPPNAKHYERDGRFARVILGDVRTWEADTHYDAVVWWHGPEHIARWELAKTMLRLEQMADLVLVACPWGEYPQGAYGGNPHEEHVAALLPEDFTALGYEVATLGKCDDSASNLIAWKRKQTIEE